MLCLLNHRCKLEGRRRREKEEYWHERLRARSPKGLGDVEMKQRVDLGSLVSILRAAGGAYIKMQQGGGELEVR